ncbi:thioredoxin domain-containing protein [Demequina aestuarii]|uniref:thioredoxin domain-containing protein n=1 Tax=Demequina aestuarii TaxID=327095 RepID=UPI0007857667|nr:thioredoxin domain-containing protein [Demequina aestuarii]
MTQIRTAKRAALTAWAALLLTGCAAGASDITSPSPAPPSTTSAAPEPAITAADATPEDSAADSDVSVEVPEALRFEATLLANGEVFDGTSLAGQDVLIWIWAPWCPVCQAEAPDVAAAAAELPDGVAIYGLPGKADAASSQAFVEDYRLDGFPHIFSEDGSLWQNFGVSYQPALVMVGDDGSVETIPGSMSKQDIIDAAAQLAAE